MTIAPVLALSIAGCGSAGTGTSGQTTPSGETNAPPTLTKATLPTEVGTKWTVVRMDEEGTPLDLKVEGPWTVTPGPDWRTESNEIVAPEGVPGIEKFKDYTYVQKDTSEDFGTYYYPRQVTDDWVFGLGRINASGDDAIAEPSAPAKFWPLQLEVSQTYQLYENAERNTAATVLARNTANMPAGTIENAYLVRFRTEAAGDSGKPNDTYYLFAPNVGMVAYFSRLTGDEKAGFTAAGSIVVLSTMPTK